MRAASRIALACLTAVSALVCGSAAPAGAEFLTKLIVKVTPATSQPASGASVDFTVTVRADGSVKAEHVTVTMAVPTGTVFSKCTMKVTEGADSTQCTPGLANGVVTAFIGRVAAWKTPSVKLTLTMPIGPKDVTLQAHADSTTATDDTNSATITVLPPEGTVTYWPSGRIGPISCGATLKPEDFGTDTTVQLNGNLGCTSGGWGLRITAAGKTLNFNAKRIRWDAALAPGTVGVLVSNAIGVTIIGGGIKSGNGIELFDTCVKDELESKRLTITNFLCLKARSAGIDIASRNVKILGVKTDLVAGGTATNTADLPGGVGIRTRADIALIKDSRVVRSKTVGIWVSGSDTNLDGVVAQIDNTSIEKSPGIGLFIEGGPHSVTDTDVQGDSTLATLTSTDGVVIAPTGIGNRLKQVVVKEFLGNGFVINGTGTDLANSEVDGVGLDGYVVTGSGSVLSTNTATDARHGFIVSGPATCATAPCIRLESNKAEDVDGDGYVVTGAGASLKNNKAESNGGVGFNAFGTGNHFNTNTASFNGGKEWVVGPGQVDEGGNKASGTVFPLPSAGGESPD